MLSHRLILGCRTPEAEISCPTCYRTWSPRAGETAANQGSSRRQTVPNYTGVITPRELVMTWLAHGVPLALIADLADPSGPRSREICTVEAVADDVRRDAETLVIPSRVIDLGERAVEDFSAAEAG